MTGSIDVFALTAGLLGGLGLFLLGLRQLTDSLKRLAGDRLTTLIGRFTSSRAKAVGAGIAVTAVVQSSSITTVLAVGFVAAGAMTFVQSVGVVLGANVGTTITAQTIAFDIGTWALTLVAVGALGLVFARSSRIEVRASALLGLGLVFFGMQVMSTAVEPLRESEVFLDAMARFTNPALGIAAGAVATALLQSSSATTAMVITLASQGLVSLPAGAAIVVGANVGSCVTAGLAAIGKPAAAKRVAAFHVLVNLLGAAVWVFFLDQLIDLADAITPGSEGGAAAARQLANAHTIFNVSVMLALFPLAGRLAALVERLVPDHEPVDEPLLDRQLLETPSLALAAVRYELASLGDVAVDMVQRSVDATLFGTRATLDALAATDDEIDRRYRSVVAYLSDLGHQPLSASQADELVALVSAADSLENIGDIVETNLVGMGRRRLDAQVGHRPERVAIIRDVHEAVVTALRDTVHSLLEPDDQTAVAVLDRKADLNTQIDRAVTGFVRDLDGGDGRAVLAHTLEVDVVEALRRVYDITRRLARARLGLG